jgi:hypothetical protein
MLIIVDIKTLESHLDQIKQKHSEARDPIVAQMRKLADSFQSSAEAIKTQMVTTLQTQTHNEIQNAFVRYDIILKKSNRVTMGRYVNTMKSSHLKMGRYVNTMKSSHLKMGSFIALIYLPILR